MRISTSVLKLVYKTETNAHQSGSGVERPLNQFVECESNRFQNQTTSLGGLVRIEPV